MGVKAKRIRRGDVVLIALPGDYGKPRPAVVVQTDLVNDTHASVTLCPLTSHLVAAPLFRLDVEPSDKNGLQKHSQVMVDKIATVRWDRVREVVGHLDEDAMLPLGRSLAFWLGLP